MPPRKALAAALLCALLAGCAAPLPSAQGPASPNSTPSPAPQRPNLGVANGTTLAVTLVVNGHRVAVIPSGGSEPSIASLPSLPWTVEALSPSGRVLTSMHVQPGGAVVLDTSGAVQSGQQSLVDLSCGRLTIWAGPFEPGAPPPPASPGTPGDCAP